MRCLISLGCALSWEEPPLPCCTLLPHPHPSAGTAAGHTAQTPRAGHSCPGQGWHPPEHIFPCETNQAIPELMEQGTHCRPPGSDPEGRRRWLGAPPACCGHGPAPCSGHTVGITHGGAGLPEPAQCTPITPPAPRHLPSHHSSEHQHLPLVILWDSPFHQ